MWHPHVTVAAIIEHNNKYLLVRDKTSTGIKLNQPAGHLEPNEIIIDAIIREVKEETGLDFIPQKLTGIYLMPANAEVTYLRFCFSGTLKDYLKSPHPLETETNVHEALWLSLDEIKKRHEEHRAIVVLKSIEDYLNGTEYPLSLLTSYDNQSNLIK